MEVAFDPAKDAINIAKHGISLKRAEDFDFDTALYDEDDSQDYGEVRLNAIGWLGALLIHSPSLRTAVIRSVPSAFVKRPNRSNNVMSKNHDEPIPDAENPEWTADKFARAKRLHELPERLQQILSSRKRGPQKAPTKTLISLRLSSDVLEALRAQGKGWQTIVDEALRRQFVK